MSKARSRKKVTAWTEAERARSNRPASGLSELELYRGLWNLSAQFREGRDADKVFRSALRFSLDYFDAGEGCVAVNRPGREHAEIMLPVPQQSWWDTELLAGFLRGRKVSIPPELMLARIRRFGRMWGALVVRSSGADFRWDARQAFSSVGVVTSQLAERIDRDRVREVRARIDQKVLEQIRPKNLFYQVLHGIRSLTGYDHSAALLTCDDQMNTLEVVAEQVAWQKTKSQNVGLKLPLTPNSRELLGKASVFGFDRNGKAWIDWTNCEATELAELLDYNRGNSSSAASHAEGAIIGAPLVTRDGVLGFLKVAAVHEGTFGPYEAVLVSQFLPQVALALQNLRRAENLEGQVLVAERKTAMAGLARGVSHDVNNALGSVLPLVQQLREDLKDGDLEADVAAEDLRKIERSLQVCRRIFGGMLNFATSASRNESAVNLRHEVDTTLAILKDGLERHKIRVEVEVPSNLPSVRGVQSDIEQLLLNLISNARDAMQAGDSLSLRAVRSGNTVELSVQDTGCGIPKSHISKIQEPFFTTKESGNGLGLAICRSIVSQMRGRMSIESEAGRGTLVRVELVCIEGEG